MSYKMVVLDLDGTVVNRRGQISPRTRAAVRAARDAGLLVMVATGRRLRSALPYIHELGLDGPAIFCNGALAVDLSTWRTLACATLGAAGTAAAANWLRAGLAPLACRHVLRGPDLLYQTPPQVTPDWLLADECAGHLGYTADLAIEAAGAVKLMAIAHGPIVRALATADRLPGSYMTTVGEDGSALVELWREDVSKGATVQVLARRAGIQSAEILAFGDNDNDVELLAYAGLGVAMGNATPAARAAASTVCATCEEDGVAGILEFLVRSQRAAV